MADPLSISILVKFLLVPQSCYFRFLSTAARKALSYRAREPTLSPAPLVHQSQTEILSSKISTEL